MEEELLLVDISTNSITATTAIRLLILIEVGVLSSAANDFVGVFLLSFLHIKPVILSSLKIFANLKLFAGNPL